MAPGVVYLLGSGLDALAVDTLYSDAKDGDVLLVQFGKGVMQRDAQEMCRAGQACIQHWAGNVVGLIEYLAQMLIGAALGSAILGRRPLVVRYVHDSHLF
ncbi:MAG TPA: hypothetical protein DCK83_10550 [Gallionellaceae bacterium]|nr:hypothetical protein [Gallionellaceae bacterium]